MQVTNFVKPQVVLAVVSTGKFRRALSQGVSVKKKITPVSSLTCVYNKSEKASNENQKERRNETARTKVVQCDCSNISFRTPARQLFHTVKQMIRRITNMKADQQHVYRWLATC